MAQIDKFIEAFHRLGGERLEVVSGERVVVARAGDRREMTKQPATSEQVAQLLQEVMPSELRSGDVARHGQEFTYEAPSGPVRVESQRADGALRLLVTPLPAGGEAVKDPSSATTNGSPGSNGSGAVAAQGDTSALDALLEKMVKEDCSDLHISAGNPPMFRKDGHITTLGEDTPLSPSQTEALLFSITPERNRKQFDERYDTDFAYGLEGLARFRVNLFMDRKGVGGAFRAIPSDVLTVEDLGFSEQLLDLCKLSKGLVLVTGPTGSGKSTTLAAMVDYINRTRSEHIITIEDPIEFVHENKQCLVNQREVGIHTDSFKIALRAALREDPDVVLIGELRDLETVEMALETAETGHLVLGTLHTNTAASTVDRIIDQFPADQQNQIRALLSDTLKGVLAQTLCRKKAGGRALAMEVLIVIPAVANLIREGKTYQIPSIIQTNRGAGMRTMTDALVDLVASDAVAPEEAYVNAIDKNEFKKALSRRGLPANFPD